MNFSKIICATAVCACAVAFVAGCNTGKKKEANTAAPEAGNDEAAVEATAEATVEAAAETVAPEFKDDDVLVDVDGTKLTYGEAIKTVKRMLTAQGAPADQIDMIAKQMSSQALPRISEQFVLTSLLKAEAAKRGFKAVEADVDEAISNMVARLPQDMTFQDALDKMGTTLEDARKEIADGVPVNKLLEEITKEVQVAEEEIKKFYEENSQYFEQPEQVEASHILIKVDDATNEVAKAAAKAKCEELRAQILAGTNFAELAAANSDCPSKSQGGNLGYFGKGQMVPQFEEAAFALETNQVSEVVETRFGYHVIKVTGKKAASKIALDDVRDRIKDQLAGNQKGEIFEKFIADLKGKAKIVMHEALEAMSKPSAAQPVIESEPVEVPTETNE